MEPPGSYRRTEIRRPSFYGWYIVGVGVLSNVASVFSFSSTLSVFLKPVSEDLGVSRGTFSLVRTGEILVNALIVPFIGPVIDRHGGRWLIATGAVIASAGYLLLSQVQEFWQFLLGRCSVVVVGDTLMNSLVTVTGECKRARWPDPLSLSSAVRGRRRGAATRTLDRSRQSRRGARPRSALVARRRRRARRGRP